MSGGPTLKTNRRIEHMLNMVISGGPTLKTNRGQSSIYSTYPLILFIKLADKKFKITVLFDIFTYIKIFF